MRTFIAVDVKNESILKALEELKNTGADIKIVSPENLHITLKFLGEIEEKKVEEIYTKISEKARGFKKFKLALKGVGVFPNKKFMRVVWIGGESMEMIEIQKTVEEVLSSLGFKKENDFKTHLTLARVKSAKNKEKLEKFVEQYESFDFGSAEIDRIEIKKSELTKEGAVYTTLREILL